MITDAKSKIIRTLDTPDDLFILGRLPDVYERILCGFVNKREQLAAELGITMDVFVIIDDILTNNSHTITDDYSTLWLKGDTSPKANFHIETTGYFQVLTKTELKTIINLLPITLEEDFNDSNWDEHDILQRRDNYVMMIPDFVGNLSVALFDDDWNDVMISYDNPKDGLYYSTVEEGAESGTAGVVCTSGMTCRYLTHDRIAFGYNFKDKKTVYRVYKDGVTGDKILIDNGYYDAEVPEGAVLVGSQVTTERIWTKQSDWYNAI